MASRVAAFDLDGVSALPSIAGAFRRSEEASASPRDFSLGAYQTEFPEGPTEQLMKGKITFSQTLITPSENVGTTFVKRKIIKDRGSGCSPKIVSPICDMKSQYGCLKKTITMIASVDMTTSIEEISQEPTPRSQFITEEKSERKLKNSEFETEAETMKKCCFSACSHVQLPFS